MKRYNRLAPANISIRLHNLEAGPASGPVLGTQLHTGAETAAFLNAVAACELELDEGNKHAHGHPAVHVVFAAEAPNPRGDVDHFPLDRRRIRTKLAGLIGAAPADRLGGAVHGLAAEKDAAAALNTLSALIGMEGQEA